MITVRSPKGLHLRPAGDLAEYALKFHSRILLENGDRQVSAKSLLGVLSLCIRQDTELKIICEGVDEEEALEGMTGFITKMNGQSS